MYSSELHKVLSNYSILAESLDNPKIEKLNVYGFNAHDLSGISIHKTGEPFRDGSVDTLITIREILPDITLSDTSSLDQQSLESEQKIIRSTDYIRYSNGNFSKPEQITTIYSPDGHNNLTVLKALSQMTNFLMKKYVRLEEIGADDLELKNTEEHLAHTYREFDKIFSEERIFREAMGEYNSQEHTQLYKRLGSLVLF